LCNVNKFTELNNKVTELNNKVTEPAEVKEF